MRGVFQRLPLNLGAKRTDNPQKRFLVRRDLGRVKLHTGGRVIIRLVEAGNVVGEFPSLGRLYDEAVKCGETSAVF